MRDRSRVRQRPVDIKIHIRPCHSTLIISDGMGERKANARKNCTGKCNMV